MSFKKSGKEIRNGKIYTGSPAGYRRLGSRD